MIFLYRYSSIFSECFASKIPNKKKLYSSANINIPALLISRSQFHHHVISSQIFICEAAPHPSRRIFTYFSYLAAPTRFISDRNFLWKFDCFAAGSGTNFQTPIDPLVCKLYARRETIRKLSEQIDRRLNFEESLYSQICTLLAINSPVTLCSAKSLWFCINLPSAWKKKLLTSIISYHILFFYIVVFLFYNFTIEIISNK